MTEELLPPPAYLKRRWKHLLITASGRRFPKWWRPVAYEWGNSMGKPARFYAAGIRYVRPFGVTEKGMEASRKARREG